MTNEERILKLEEELARLRRHVVEQDKVMMEMHDTLSKLKRELLALRERGDGGLSGGDAMPTDEKPPHY